MHEERWIRNLHQLDAVNVFDCFDDLFTMSTGGGADGNVANDVIVADCDDVDGSDVTTGAANCHRHLAKCSGTRRELEAQSQTVNCAGCRLHIGLYGFKDLCNPRMLLFYDFQRSRAEQAIKLECI